MFFTLLTFLVVSNFHLSFAVWCSLLSVLARFHGTRGCELRFLGVSRFPFHRVLPDISTRWQLGIFGCPFLPAHLPQIVGISRHLLGGGVSPLNN